jgi:hypothetical protein
MQGRSHSAERNAHSLSDQYSHKGGWNNSSSFFSKMRSIQTRFELEFIYYHLGKILIKHVCSLLLFRTS